MENLPNKQIGVQNDVFVYGHKCNITKMTVTRLILSPFNSTSATKFFISISYFIKKHLGRCLDIFYSIFVFIELQFLYGDTNELGLHTFAPYCYALRKHAYSNIGKISPPKKLKFFR